MQTRRKTIQHSMVVASLLATAGFPQFANAAFNKVGFDAKSIQDAVKAYGGGNISESKDVTVTAPDIAENGAVVPVRIEIDTSVLSDVSKIYVIVEKNPNPLAAVFQVPPNTQPYAETRVKVAQTGNLYAVAEANGQLYMMQRETKVTLGGCGG